MTALREMIDEPTSPVIAFSGQLDIEQAENMKVLLLAKLAEQDEIFVDLKEVESINTAALQVLLAARQDAEINGRKLRFGPMPDPVQQLLEAIGLPLSCLSDTGGKMHAA